MGLQEPVSLVLVAGDLQGDREFGLLLAWFEFTADAPDAIQQEQQAEDEAGSGHGHEEPGSPVSVRRRGRLLGRRVVLFFAQQPVQVRAERLVGGRQAGGSPAGN
jgi:hypothetical protein